MEGLLSPLVKEEVPNNIGTLPLSMEATMRDRDETQYGQRIITSYHPVTGDILDRSVTNTESGSFLLRQLSTDGDKRSPNSYDLDVREYLNGVGTIDERLLPKGELRQRSEGVVGGQLKLTDFGITDKENALYNQALSRLNERARGSLDLSTTFLEYKQVQKMLGSAGKIESYLGNVFKAIERNNALFRREEALAKRQKRRSANSKLRFSKYKSGFVPRKLVMKTSLLKSVIKDIGGNWLQWHLGLKPLLNDFQDSVKEIYTGVVLRAMQIKGSAKDPIEVRSLPGSDPISKGTKCDIKGKQGVQFHIRFRPKTGFNVDRWTSLNPASWSWELITLSFVVDYFYDIGSFIREMETAALYDHTFDSGYVTYLYAFSGPLATKTHYLNNWEDRRIHVDYVASVKVIRLKRRRLGSWPLPRQPTFKLDLGSNQLLTIASLLAQKLKR